MAIVRNLATVKTTADITSSATSIPVNRTNVFGAAQNPLDNPFYVTIMPASGSEPANTTNSEIALVTGISGTNLIVTRGQRSTTARAFSAGAIVTMGIYAEDAVLLGGGGTTVSATVYRKKLVDKDENTIIPIMGNIGPVYTASMASASGGIATYTFTPDTPVEANRVYAVKFPAPSVNNAVILLGDGNITASSILLPPASATDSPSYEIAYTYNINDTEVWLLMYTGSQQWVCLNQKKPVSDSDIDWTSLNGTGTVTSGGVTWTWMYLPNGKKMYCTAFDFSIPSGSTSGTGWRNSTNSLTFPNSLTTTTAIPSITLSYSGNGEVRTTPLITNSNTIRCGSQNVYTGNAYTVNGYIVIIEK